MPIKSYLAYPAKDRRDELAEVIRALPGCHVIPAVNRDLLVVVTDTPDEAADQVLQDALSRVESLQGLALVAGVGDGAVPADAPEEATHDQT